MPRGGFRPGAGRKPGSGKTQPEDQLHGRTVYLKQAELEWMEFWFPGGNPTEQLRELMGRARKFWPKGPASSRKDRQGISAKPIKKRRTPKPAECSAPSPRSEPRLQQGNGWAPGARDAAA